MPKKSKRNAFRKAKATGIAAAVLTSVIVPSLVIGLDTVEAAEPNVDKTAKEVTRGIYKTTDYSIAYETDGVTVKLLRLTETKSPNLVLPNTIDGLPVTEIGAYFEGGSSTVITSLTLPSNIEIIGNAAFSKSKLTILVLPSGLREIKASAFNASLLTSLNIPASVEIIEKSSFANSPLTSLTFEEGSKLRLIDNEAFWKATITTLELPDSVEYIGSNTFKAAPLTFLKLSLNMVRIGNSAFEKAKLSELHLPSSLREIGEGAFKYSTFTLDSLTGYENLIGIGQNNGNKATDDLGSNTGQFRNVVEAGFSTYNGDNFTMTYKVIDGEIYLIKLKTYTGGSELVLPDAIEGKPVKNITSYFGSVGTLNVSTVTRLVLPDRLEKVGAFAFNSFTGVTEMNFPSTLTNLNTGSFSELKLTNLELPEGLESIPDSVFNSSPLNILKLPSTLQYIGSGSFMNATLNTVEIPNGVKDIGNGAFYKSTFTTLALPSSLGTIGSNAFNASVLTELTIPKSLMYLGYKSFSLSSLDKLVVMSDDVFYDTAYATDIKNTYGLKNGATIYTDLGSTTRSLGQLTPYILKPLSEAPLSTPILTKKEGVGTSKVFINMDTATDHYEYSLNDGGSWNETTEREISLTESATVQVRAYDSTGKVSPAASIEVNVLPKTELNSKKSMPTETVINKGDSLSLNYADYFEGDGLTVTTTLESETNKNLVFSGFNSMKDGKYTLSYTVSDAYGNEQTGTYNVVYLTDVQNTVTDFSLYAKPGGTVAFDVAPLLKMPSYSELSYEMSTLSGAEGSTVTFTDGKLSVQNVSEGTSVFYLTVKNQFDQEVNFTVNVHAVPNTSSKDSGVVTKPTTNDAHTLNMFVNQDETQTIPLDGLVSTLDGEVTYELTDTPAGVVEASVTGSSLTVKGLSKGYTTLNIKATDEDGDTVSLMVLVYVGSTQNSSTGGSATIDDANIKANVGYYVVPLEEVFTDSSTSGVKQYGIEVTEKNEVAAIQPLFLKRLTMASLNPAPLKQISTAPIIPTPEGVNSEVVFQDGALQVDLVNDVLLIAGYESSKYTVKVTSYTEQGPSEPKEFAVYVEGEDGSGSGDSNSGSTGGSGSGDSNSGSTGGSGSGDGNSGSTGGSGSGDSNSGSTGGSGSGDGNSGSTGDNGSSDGSETILPSGDLSEDKNGDLIIDIETGKPSISDTVDIVVDEDSIQIGSGDKEYDSPISNGLASYADKRVIREEGNGVFTTVPHFVEDNKLHIKTKNPNGLVITSRVASNFTDTKSLYSEVEVEDLFNYLITTGTTATTYSPYKNITRSQFAVMIARALELKPKGEYAFKDGSSQWYADEVQALYEAGIITGYGDGTFGGGNDLTRQQAALMIERMLRYMGMDTKVTNKVQLADLDKVADYAKPAVQFLAQHDILNHGKDVEFNPYNHLNRAQMAKMLMRSLRLTEWY